MMINNLIVKGLFYVFIERLANSTTSNESEKKAHRYYESCMDPNKTIDALGATPLLNVLRDLGGWNVSKTSGTWNSSR